MVDQNRKVWLLEINTNPCLEESSQLLKMYIPRMLDDMFKLTVDVRYRPKVPVWEGSSFPVEGYPDDENMWVKLYEYQLEVKAKSQMQRRWEDHVFR